MVWVLSLLPISPWDISLFELDTVPAHIIPCPFAKGPLDRLVCQPVAASLECFRKDQFVLVLLGQLSSEGVSSACKFDEWGLWECLGFELISFD